MQDNNIKITKKGEQALRIPTCWAEVWKHIPEFLKLEVLHRDKLDSQNLGQGTYFKTKSS